MKLNTPVEIKPLEGRLTYRDSILFVGSCFADEIGRRCTERYFDTRVNPFGVLFNPCSISDCLGLLEGYGINAEQCSFIPEDVIETSGGFCSFHHHGSMARPTAQEFLDNANKVLADASDFYYREGWVVVTLGTAFIYTDKESGNVVANCHKLPADRFERTMISADQVYNALSQYVAARPATLHLGIEKLVNRYPNAHYFPAYEILMDELRDYRFYADDMMHPSAQAADYIFERFMDFVLADSDRPLLAEAEKVRGMMQHRILNAGTAQAAKFEAQRNQALESLLSKIR